MHGFANFFPLGGASATATAEVVSALRAHLSRALREPPAGRRYPSAVATKSKKTASYDLKAADRRRNVMIQVGLTAVVVIFAVALVLYIVTSGKHEARRRRGEVDPRGDRAT